MEFNFLNFLCIWPQTISKRRRSPYNEIMESKKTEINSNTAKALTDAARDMISANRANDAAQAAPSSASPRSALVMEGGAMRGMFTCGVIDVLMENGITFDAASGISAGAVFGCNYKSHQIGRAIRYNKKYCKDPRYSSFRSLMKTGDFFGADFCYREIPDELDIFDRETFAKEPMEFYIGATDVLTGEIRYHRCIDGGMKDIEWMRASASMPILSKVVRIDGHQLLDGGISDAIPYSYMEELGYRKNVIVLTQPEGYEKKKSSKVLFKMFLRKYPAIVEAMGKRHIMYNRQLEEVRKKEASGESLVIRPPEDLKIGRACKKPEELERVYQIGRAEAKRRLPEIRKFLGQQTAQ